MMTNDYYVGSRWWRGKPRRCRLHRLGLWYVLFNCYFIITLFL